jgi:hypothetical protein
MGLFLEGHFDKLTLSSYIQAVILENLEFTPAESPRNRHLRTIKIRQCHITLLLLLSENTINNLTKKQLVFKSVAQFDRPS